MVEVGVLLAALLVFVWWQRRDLRRAKEATALQRERERSLAQAQALVEASAKSTAQIEPVPHAPPADSMDTRQP